MRLPALLVLVLVFTFACARAEPVRDHEPVLDRRPRRSVVATEPVREPHASPLDVGGTVATDLGHPVVGRRVVLVDARGAQYLTTTNEVGRFAVPGVTPPYDLAVAPGPDGAVNAFLAASRSDPHVELFERDGPTQTPARQQFRVGVAASLCPATSWCWVTVATASPSGSGEVTGYFRAEDGLAVVDVEQGWHRTSLVPQELVDVHVLVGNDEQSWFAYARLPSQRAAPGDHVDLGIASVQPVEVSEPLSLDVAPDAGALAGWSWASSVSLDLPGDPGGPVASCLFALRDTASSTLRVPRIPGATMRASMLAQHPRVASPSGFSRSTEAWSGAVAIPTSLTFGIAPGPELLRPQPDGALARRGTGFAWSSATGPALFSLLVVDLARGVPRFRVHTNEPEVAFARLRALGISRLEPGQHLLELASVPSAAVQDVLSEDVDVRHRHRDPTRPGAVMRIRVPFTVTP